MPARLAQRRGDRTSRRNRDRMWKLDERLLVVEAASDRSHAVRSAERVQLQGMLSDWQFLVVGRPGDGAVDVGESAA